MQPAESAKRIIFVQDATGAAVTSLATADFTFIAYADGVAFTHASTVAHIAAGYYLWTYTLPARSIAFIDCRPTSAAYRCALARPRSVAFAGEVEDHDMDALYAATARPVISLNGDGTLGQVVPLTLYKDRWRKLEYQIVDENDDPVLLSTNYNNWKIAVRSQDQSTTEWDGVGAVITPADSGLLTVEIPETASFFAALASGVDTASLFYEITADYLSTSSKTVAIVPSSALTVNRSEVGQ